MRGEKGVEEVEEMIKSKAFIVSVLSILFVALFINTLSVTGQQTLQKAYQERTCKVYDTFSTGTLDAIKWKEIPGSDLNQLFVDEHFVDITDNTYHTAQLTPADRGVTLEMLNKIFRPGDRIEFDLNYKSGDGNSRINYIDLNGNTKWWGVMGIWGGAIQQGGNDFGVYHYKIYFTINGPKIFITKPDMTMMQIQNFPATSPGPYTFGFGTRTGGSGTVHMDYDNIVICK